MPRLRLRHRAHAPLAKNGYRTLCAAAAADTPHNLLYAPGRWRCKQCHCARMASWSCDRELAEWTTSVLRGGGNVCCRDRRAGGTRSTGWQRWRPEEYMGAVSAEQVLHTTGGVFLSGTPPCKACATGAQNPPIDSRCSSPTCGEHHLDAPTDAKEQAPKSAGIRRQEHFQHTQNRQDRHKCASAHRSASRRVDPGCASPLANANYKAEGDTWCERNALATQSRCAKPYPFIGPRRLSLPPPARSHDRCSGANDMH